MIKFIGSKRALLPWILAVVDTVDRAAGVRRVLDPFSGTARVGHALKRAGYQVTAGDVTAYAHVIATALVEADARDYPESLLRPVLEELGRADGPEGYFTRTFCREARYFHPDNGRRIEAVRRAIPGAAGGDRVLEAILLCSLLLAADRVDSTTGVQMAYLKSWAPRASNPLELRVPPLVEGSGRALRVDARDLIREAEADLAYLDPPYNQHCHLGNYHVWETLVLDDEPEAYGVARKRVDCRERKSPFNLKTRAPAAMVELLDGVSAPHVVLSYSDEGTFGIDQMEEELRARRGLVTRLERGHERYVGARIGIYNPSGERVGKVSHTRNREFLLVASRDERVHEALREERAAIEAAAGGSDQMSLPL